ncbi:MAG TPA: hypothetical protein VGN26_21665 [Armatimonadota bacterium]|jgi:hypothetical protein
MLPSIRCLALLGLLLVGLLTTTPVGPAPSLEPTRDDVAGQSGGPFRRLFLDPLNVSRQQGLTRVFHPLERHPGSPVLKATEPWEREGSGPYLYGTVLWDGGRLRMWYHLVNGGYRNAYAESADGLHWTKPRLGLREFGGSKDNNLFLTVTQDPKESPVDKDRGQCHNPSVIKQTWEKDPSKRYALFCWGADYNAVRVAYSPDGLRWSFVPETARRGLFESSDVVNFAYDPYQKRYLATWKGATRRGRSVGVAVSPDGLRWEKLSQTPLFAADDLDPPETQVYGMPVFPYQGLYIGLPWIYHAKVHYPPEMLMTREEAEVGSPCTVDVRLAWSHDLVNWTRPPDRQPFLPLGPKGALDSGMVYTARAPVQVGDRLYFYYGGFDGPHNSGASRAAIGLATLRLDGFCSLHAGDQEGWLITKREKLTRPEVTLNARTELGGSVKAEILDLSGKPIPGFTRQECLPFTGDSTAHTLRWRTPRLPKSQEGTVKQLRVFLRKADIYSYLPAD